MYTLQLTAGEIEMMKQFQENEITEYHIYKRLSETIRDEENSKILLKIADEELAHYHFWRGFTQLDVKPKKGKLLFYYLISRLFGLTFGIKLMEKGENKAQKNYASFAKIIPGATKISEEEEKHENELIGMIHEEKLNYIGSVVLGLNDALVELTGALAGFSLALQNTRLIALVGLITGIAASMSMAASEYLSTKAEGNGNEAARSAFYTGMAYIGTVIILILPYLIFEHYLICLMFTLVLAVLIIFFFNYYISVAKDLDFKKRFAEMFIISMGVAVFSFGIGFLIRKMFGIDV
jgi:vacuolar iron transporter family protein